MMTQVVMTQERVRTGAQDEVGLGDDGSRDEASHGPEDERSGDDALADDGMLCYSNSKHSH